MKMTKGLTRTADGRFTCTVGKLKRHFKVILRFVGRTDAVVYITRKGKNDLVLMSYRYYLRLADELDDIKRALQQMLSPKATD